MENNVELYHLTLVQILCSEYNEFNMLKFYYKNLKNKYFHLTRINIKNN